MERINKMTDAEQTALAKSLLEQGLPTGEAAGALYSLAVGRSSLILPLLEGKIEEVLRSSNPVECFTNKTIDPERAVLYLALTITEAGDLEAFRQAGELAKIDEKRFAFMVKKTLYAAVAQHHNPFMVAYQGFSLRNPAIDRGIAEWANETLAREVPHAGNPIYDGVMISPRRQWAEALVDRYGGVPTPDQWTADPIVSHVKSETAGFLYNDMHRFAAEAAQKRVRK